MNKLKHLPKSIPDKNHVFSIENVIGETTRTEYSGDFECVIPNNRTSAKIAKSKALYNGGLDASLDQFTKNLHHMVAYCKHTIREAPEWFIESEYGYDLYDFNILEEVYGKVLKLEEEWLSSVWGKDDK